MKLSSARSILPALMLVCLFSFVLRGMEVWSGMKSMGGTALAVEPSAEELDSSASDTTEISSNDNNPIEISDSDAPTSENDEQVMTELEGIQDVSPIQMEITQDLVKQRKRLETREAQLLQKEALLQAAEQELDRKYQELVALKIDIENLLVTQSEEEEKQINSLVKIYENMKPKEAAAIFNTLDLDILVEVISRMSERKSSPIMAALNPERARTVTIMLAEQKSLPALPIQ